MAHQVVIFVHGMSSRLLAKEGLGADYFLGLRDRIAARLAPVTVVPPGAASGAPRAITFDYVDYSDIGQAEQERVLRAYVRDRAALYGPIDGLIETLALGRIRFELITALADVLVYRTESGCVEVRQRLYDVLGRYLGHRGPVSIVAHSLGSVVAFETLYYCRADPAWVGSRFQAANLFSMGSPLALFTAVLDNPCGSRPFPAEGQPSWQDTLRAAAGPPSAVECVVPRSGAWLNFLDPQDLLAYPLGSILDARFTATPVVDVAVQTGYHPLSAHAGYWENDAVAHRIADQLEGGFRGVGG